VSAERRDRLCPPVGDDALSEIRAVYESDGCLRVPPVVFNA